MKYSAKLFINLTKCLSAWSILTSVRYLLKITKRNEKVSILGVEPGTLLRDNHSVERTTTLTVTIHFNNLLEKKYGLIQKAINKIK